MWNKRLTEKNEVIRTNDRDFGRKKNDNTQLQRAAWWQFWPDTCKSLFYIEWWTEKKVGKQYHKEIMSYAMTLQFYSTYKYVRQMLLRPYATPCSDTEMVRQGGGWAWIHSDSIWCYTEKSLSNEEPVFLALMLDEMTIKKTHIPRWDNIPWVCRYRRDVRDQRLSTTRKTGTGANGCLREQ